MFKLKNAISPVIAVILLLAITVVVSMSMYSFLQDYTENTTSSLSSNEILGNVEIKHLFANNLFLNSENDMNLSLLRISDLGGTELCSFSGNNEINLGGLVAHWTFDELSYNGTHYMIEDISGNGNNGTLSDNNHSNSDGSTLPQLVESNNGNALKFNGVDDYVHIPQTGSIIKNNYTIVSFLKSSKYDLENNQVIIGQWNCYVNCNEGSWVNIISNYQASRNSFNFYITNQTSDRVGNSNLEKNYYELANNEPLFLVSTYDSDSFKTYVNLDLDSQFVQENQIINESNEPILIGASSHGLLLERNLFKGEIDEIRIYNTSLTEAELALLYWNFVNSQKKGLSQIDLSSCNLQRNQQYKITMIANGEKIESTQFVN